VKRLCIPHIRHILRYLRRLAAPKIVSSLTSSRDLFLSHAATSLHSVQLGTMILLGTPWGQSALMASNARSRSGALNHLSRVFAQDRRDDGPIFLQVRPDNAVLCGAGRQGRVVAVGAQRGLGGLERLALPKRDGCRVIGTGALHAGEIVEFK
jgi:hypothetical protein